MFWKKSGSAMLTPARTKVVLGRKGLMLVPAVPDEFSSGTVSIPRCGVTSGYFFGLGLGLGEAVGTSSKKVTL